MGSKKRGFTLVEVMIASVIGAFVALVAVGTLKAISVSAEMVESNINTAAEVRFSTRMISTDLLNLYRDRDLRNTKFVGTVEETEYGQTGCLTFYTVGRTKARFGQPEGDVYEVEYYLMKNDEELLLMRRLWPNPDEEAQPGGILSVIAENIDVFEVRYFDGQDWQTEWPEEMRSVPELVEVTIVARQPGRTDVVVETFIVNFAGSSGAATEALEGSDQEENVAEK